MLVKSFSLEDTIVAIATPSGRGAIGIVRLSGPSAPDIARGMLAGGVALEPRRATLARLAAHAAPLRALDEIIVTWFAAPASYTGQHVVEMSAHGSPVVLHEIVRRALDSGARLARAGEFTLRAFLHGKRDLVQAEAVADLIGSATTLQARQAFDQLDGTLTRRIAAIDAGLLDLVARLEASLDFPEEGYHFVEPGAIAAAVAATVRDIDALLRDATRGRLIREGATVVIAGRTNVGKSSLFNAIVGTERAIVTEVPGTTRDLVTERVDIGGVAVTLVDTAGAREAADIVEREGVSRGARARDTADLVLVILDRTVPVSGEDRHLLSGASSRAHLVVVNKSDCPGVWVADDCERLGVSHVLDVSARTGEGLPALRDAIARALTGGESSRETAAISNVRHIDLLRQARAHLETARRAAESGPPPEEFLLVDLQAARRCFDEIVGTRTSEDILNLIFERFCIGK